VFCKEKDITAFYDIDVIIYYEFEQSVLYCLYTVKAY